MRPATVLQQYTADKSSLASYCGSKISGTPQLNVQQRGNGSVNKPVLYDVQESIFSSSGRVGTDVDMLSGVHVSTLI